MPQTASGASKSGWIQFMRGCAQQWNAMTDAEKHASAKQPGIKHIVVDAQGKPTKRVRTKMPVKLDLAKPSSNEPPKTAKKRTARNME